MKDAEKELKKLGNQKSSLLNSQETILGEIKMNENKTFKYSFQEEKDNGFYKNSLTATGTYELVGDVEETTPDNMPRPLGKPVDIRMWVDSDHAGEKRTRRSRTGFFIYINMACIDWVSKRQSTIETSVFGAEFVAMKHGMEKLRGLRYKLRMMGMPIDHGQSLVYGNNKSAITNSSRPESVLKKKCNSICYHACRESVAMDESRFAHISTHDNWADFLTKVTSGATRRRLVGNVLFDIYDDKTKHVRFDIDVDKTNR
mgnify:CR=1 FL=1